MDLYPAGYRFKPFENELINSYLKPKLLGLDLPCDVVKERKLYGDGVNPWQVFDPENYPWILNEVSSGKFEKIAYAFVNLTKKATNSKSKVGKENFNKKAGCGNWNGQTSRTEIKDFDGKLIGERRMLSFEINEVSAEEDSRRVGHWRMHEYNLCGINSKIPNPSNIVLCKITLDLSKKAPIKILHPDKTTHSSKARAGEKNDTKKNSVKMDVVVTDLVQTYHNDDAEQIWTEDELFNMFFVVAEDGNYNCNIPDFQCGSNPELEVEQTLEDVTTNVGKRKLQEETSRLGFSMTFQPLCKEVKLTVLFLRK
ncbi:hypothetical protein POM88_036216 [Heracleum sosnowskyi]|uniref:NAC domain-containing protein n=1 Tax=Heracleum sosnowskyi TaxID=360622 RepID=A0AAD8HPD3_9APIA|nr:hypothetical protein POM88_036216 [Heracleum sosnowskyi]